MTPYVFGKGFYKIYWPFISSLAVTPIAPQGAHFLGAQLGRLNDVHPSWKTTFCKISARLFGYGGPRNLCCRVEGEVA
jgi:hypothetical protein